MLSVFVGKQFLGATEISPTVLLSTACRSTFVRVKITWGPVIIARLDNLIA
jgi:hypothetical protein